MGSEVPRIGVKRPESARRAMLSGDPEQVNEEEARREERGKTSKWAMNPEIDMKSTR